MKKPLHITIPITKVDEDQRMVYGYATVEEIDAHGEIITYEASKKAFSDWIGNIREMHQDIAVGKAIEIEFDDDAKGIWIGAHISESTDGENAWIKCKEGVLAGFSIGGRVNESELRTMSVDGKKKAVPVITDYVLGETSLVDNPAVASAVFQMVKSKDGGLVHEEKLSKGIGRPVHWWERQYKFSDNQDIMKAEFMTYNENSMSSNNMTLTKSLWEAGMLVDLAMCLSDYIYWKSWEGEDVDELKTALQSIQSAAAKEVTEPGEFPELESAIENAFGALNISKKEELIAMSKDMNERKKSVVGQEDRDEDANVTVTAEENGKPEDTSAADHEAVVNEEVKSDDNASDEATEDKSVEADKDEKTSGKGKKSAGFVDIKKDTDTEALNKMISSAVADGIAKAVEPLKEEIAELKRQPADSKVKATYTVKRGEDVNNNDSDNASDESKLKKEFDQLNKRAEELAVDPMAGTHQERLDIGFKLRKLSRQMDPASVAQNAAVRATFNRV